jgi:hypothetical protein
MAQRESPVFQLVRQQHEQTEAGHKRLRIDWREHEERLETLEQALQAHELKLAALASAKQDLSKLTLSPGMVVAIVMAIIGIVGGNLASTWGMRSDIRDMATRTEERAAALKNAVEAIGRKQELNQIQIQELRETVLSQQRRRP